jgi:hypothetical protein
VVFCLHRASTALEARWRAVLPPVYEQLSFFGGEIIFPAPLARGNVNLPPIYEQLQKKIGLVTNN